MLPEVSAVAYNDGEHDVVGWESVDWCVSRFNLSVDSNLGLSIRIRFRPG